MFKNFSARKALSLILSLAMIMSVMMSALCVSAEDTEAATGETEETAAVEPVVTNLSIDNQKFKSYDNIDFEAYGENLVPDPTVADFDGDGVYKDYNAETNEGWWAKTTSQNTNLKASNLLSKDSSLSHTADGSGAISGDLTPNSNIRFPVPYMEAGKYYLVTFWAYRTDSGNQGNSVSAHYYGQDTNGTLTQYTLFPTLWMNGTAAKWSRFTFIISTGDAAQTNGCVSLFYGGSDFDRIDDIAVYELDSKIALTSIENGTLYSERDVRSADVKTLNVSTTGTSTNYSDIDFSEYGENLIPDPTVSEFDASGAYKSYYEVDEDEDGNEVINSNKINNSAAWWDKAANNYQYFHNNGTVYGSPNKLGYVSNNTALSHTSDGSGVIAATGNQSVYLPLPKLEYKEYYVITFWAKVAASETTLTVRSHSTAGNVVCDTSLHYTTSEWKRITLLWYTGGTADFAEPLLYLYRADTSVEIYLDEFEVYKLDEVYFNECYEAGHLISEKDNLPEDGKYASLTFYNDGNNATKVNDYSQIDFSEYGENLVPDSTVADFKDDGTYNTYDSATGAGWYNHAALSGQNGKDNMWASMTERDCVSSDTSLSHTADGSGVLVLSSTVLSRNANIPLPKTEARSYYLVSFWVKFTEETAADIRFYSSYYSKDLQISSSTLGDANKWHRVSFLVYTANDNCSQPSIGFWSENNTVYVDDIAVYKLDGKYGLESETNKKLSATDIAKLREGLIDGTLITSK